MAEQSRLKAGAGAALSAEIFGHPKCLAFLFATEMWERFSYYGMRALLVLYHGEISSCCRNMPAPCWALALSRPGSNPCSARLACSRLSSQIYGFYTALVYLTPIFGGLLADRVLGQRRTVIVGAVLMAIGAFHDGDRAAVPAGAVRC